MECVFCCHEIFALRKEVVEYDHYICTKFVQVKENKYWFFFLLFLIRFSDDFLKISVRKDHDTTATEVSHDVYFWFTTVS